VGWGGGWGGGAYDFSSFPTFPIFLIFHLIRTEAFGDLLDAVTAGIEDEEVGSREDAIGESLVVGDVTINDDQGASSGLGGAKVTCISR
jgi:hypothetical protein